MVLLKLSKLNEKDLKSDPKFEQSLHYIIHQCTNKPNVGKTVLYKILYFSDFDFYELFEKSLTGSKYRRIDYGPAPCKFQDAIKNLKNRKVIQETHVSYHGKKMEKYLSTDEPEISELDAQEIKHIDKEIDTLCHLNASQISAKSHQDVPVRATKDGDVINYELVFYRDPSFSVRTYDG